MVGYVFTGRFSVRISLAEWPVAVACGASQVAGGMWLVASGPWQGARGQWVLGPCGAVCHLLPWGFVAMVARLPGMGIMARVAAEMADSQSGHRDGGVPEWPPRWRDSGMDAEMAELRSGQIVAIVALMGILEVEMFS